MIDMDLITILGPTASGKTAFACQLAIELGSEVISADSRQVYKKMDIGTGKDLSDFLINGVSIPYHLIDIRNAGEKYNIYEYQQDFHRVYSDIKSRGILPILCGGSGLYIESILRGYSFVNVPENKELRKKLADKPLSELKSILSSYKILHNTTDIDTAQRAIRAIEIELFKQTNSMNTSVFPAPKSLIVGLDIERELRRNKISARLRYRLEAGMIEEVQSILNLGVSSEDLIYYGLEYKYVTLFLLGELTYNEMVQQLEIAIHQFAKRQMTWFRGMEKRGLSIYWIDANLPNEEKVYLIKKRLS